MWYFHVLFNGGICDFLLAEVEKLSAHDGRVARVVYHGRAPYPVIGPALPDWQPGQVVELGFPSLREGEDAWRRVVRTLFMNGLAKGFREIA